MSSAQSHQTPRRTPAVMFQGTGSNVGKSILTAALCRILLQDGFRVAPFKAQNMSLNSFVTRDGNEMGRAQVVQAQACRLDPDVRMNPVLLKPSSDVGCQIVVHGKPVGNMTASEYVAYKPQALAAAQAAYDSLAHDFDVTVLEGAGSPAEVNLKAHDIVNMAMARYADASVLLIGDIDRGGVFASFVGTMEILDQWERDLVAGYIVNRFRGDKSLLDDALTYMEERTGRPVLGVIDHFPDLGLPEEDSVGFKAGIYDKTAPVGEHVTIALIDFPHISNFTDFEPFLAEPDVHLAVVRSVADLQKRPDAIILPGSKNVIADLSWLQQSGLADRIRQMANNTDLEIIGVCGGFQLLGQTVGDPHRIESAGETVPGLGLLDLNTELERDKTLTRQQGVHLESGLPTFGYEIHHGQSRGKATTCVFRFEDGNGAGASSGDGRIWGSYLHGLFDADDFRRWFIDRLRGRKGLTPIGKVCARYDLEPAFDRLASAVRNQLDLDRIYQILGI